MSSSKVEKYVICKIFGAGLHRKKKNAMKRKGTNGQKKMDGECVLRRLKRVPPSGWGS